MAKEEFKNEITKRFALLVDSLKKRGYGNNTQIAKLISQPLQVVSKLLSGERIITLEQVGELCRNSNANSEWLLTGKGKMFNDPELIGFDDNLSKIVKTIPYYPDVNASAGLNFLTENGNNYSVPIKIPNVDAQAFINVFGDSMYPKYCSGEIIGIKEIEKDMVFPGHAFVIQMTDGEAYIKYIDPGKDDDHWILRSENPHYKPKQFHLSKIHKVYIIKAVITKSTLL